MTPLHRSEERVQNRYKRLQVTSAMKYRCSVATEIYEIRDTFMIYCRQRSAGVCEVVDLTTIMRPRVEAWW